MTQSVPGTAAGPSWDTCLLRQEDFSGTECRSAELLPREQTEGQCQKHLSGLRLSGDKFNGIETLPGYSSARVILTFLCTFAQMVVSGEEFQWGPKTWTAVFSGKAVIETWQLT